MSAEEEETKMKRAHFYFEINKNKMFRFSFIHPFDLLCVCGVVVGVFIYFVVCTCNTHQKVFDQRGGSGGKTFGED